MATAKRKTSFEPYWYILEDEREDENPTRWYIHPLTPSQTEQLTTFTEHGQLGFQMKSYEQALSFGLKDWDNLKDEDGDPIKFSRKNLMLIDKLDRCMLALEIYNGRKLEDTERKN